MCAGGPWRRLTRPTPARTPSASLGTCARCSPTAACVPRGVSGAREEWTVLIEDHHDGYLSWQEYLAVEARLAANNTQKRARPVREGVALCQGIIFCGICGGRVGTRYDRRDRKVSYACQVKDSARTPQCRTIDASTVDTAVSELFLSTVTAQQIGSALVAAEEGRRLAHPQPSRRNWRCSAPATTPTGQNARSATSNRKTVWWQGHWISLGDQTRRARRGRGGTGDRQSHQATKPPLPATDSLRSLAADLPRLWHADTTSPRDRKRVGPGQAGGLPAGGRQLVSAQTVPPAAADGSRSRDQES